MTEHLSTCPACGGGTIPLVYGYPDEELFAAGERGEAAIGGCVVPPPSQEVGEVCHDCGREYARPEAWAADGLLARAMALALDAHAGQLRKGTPVPYVAHPMAVASLVMGYGGSPVHAAAALLHDVVEDSDRSVAGIEEEFGFAIGALVEAATDVHVQPKPPWRERKEAFVDRLRRVHRDAALVIACDKLHNARAIVDDHDQLGDDLWHRFTAGAEGVAWYYPAVANALLPKLEHPRLERDLRDAVDQVVECATGMSHPSRSVMWAGDERDRVVTPTTAEERVVDEELSSGHKSGESMKQATRYGDIPRVPAIYAMYGGLPPRTWVAYVGLGGNLNQRLVQHFDSRNSSVVTGVSAVALNVDAVAYVDWWEHEAFSEKPRLHGAEWVASVVLKPALRSRAGLLSEAAEFIADDSPFRREMEELFSGPASGRYIPPNLARLTDRVEALEQKLTDLESRLRDG